MPATVAAVRIFLGLDPASTTDEAAMAAAVAAANDEAVEYRPDVTTDDTGAVLDEWPARIDEGAILRAARMYGRRGSVQGVAAFADVGVSLLPSLDPDVRMLWGLGSFQRSVIA